MIFNPDKFQAIILDKKKTGVINKYLVIDSQQIKTVLSVELSGIQPGGRLNFKYHISNICRTRTNQSKVLMKLWIF